MDKLISAEVDFEIPFHDVDSMHIVWHGYYYKYFELARTALFRKLDYDVPEMLASEYGWPVVETACRYLRPLLYGMPIKIRASLVEYQHRVKIIYEIFDKTSQKKMCKGHTTQVAFDMKRKETCFVTPEVFLERLKRFS